MFLIDVIHFILDLAALAVWVNWRAYPENSQRLAPPATLVGTLRRADAPWARRWHHLAGLFLLLAARALLYRFIGSAVLWTGTVSAGVVTVPFRNDSLWTMLIFSFVSFAVVFWMFHLWVVLLSILNPSMPVAAPFQQFARQHLGAVDRWPFWGKCLGAFVGTSLLWWIASWPLTAWGFLPGQFSAVTRLEQSAVIGIAGFFCCKYLVTGILLLHLLNSHVYFGGHGFWEYVTAISRILLRPLGRLPLRAGRVDFAPVVMTALVLGISYVAVNGLAVSKNYKMPGLVDLYARLPF